MLRVVHLDVPTELIEELYNECNFQAGVRRIAPTNVSCRVAKYNGEIVAVDI